jgi:hypothetical protein
LRLGFDLGLGLWLRLWLRLRLRFLMLRRLCVKRSLKPSLNHELDGWVRVLGECGTYRSSKVCTERVAQIVVQIASAAIVRIG